MARTKKSESTPVRIRFKELKGGNKSIYLDIYSDGKRRYEFLKLFLVPETDQASRQRNDNTMKAANAIKSQRIIDITNKKPSVVLNDKARMTLLEWLDEFSKIGDAKGRKALVIQVRSLNQYLKAYNPRIRLCEADGDFMEGFVAYLCEQDSKKTKRPLSKSTIKTLCIYLRGAVGCAVDMNILSENRLLVFNLNSIVGERKHKEYLTMEEVQNLIDTPCQNMTAKSIFLFSCFCGLRHSDIKALRWKDIVEDRGKLHIELRQQKTGQSVYLPLSEQAQKYLPQKKGEPEDKVFEKMPTTTTFINVLDRWAKAAGITKHVSFHVARHSFATMTLTAGSDIYTTSQLLGHAAVESTQVYGKIIDKKKIEAVYMVDKLFEEN